MSNDKKSCIIPAPNAPYVAFVTDAAVIDLFPAVVSHFVKAEIKHFDFDEFEKAVEWIS